MKRLHSPKGLTLIASVMLLVFASIIILGLSTFVIQRLSLGNTRLIQTQAFYDARAGIYQSLYDYRLRQMTGDGFFHWGRTDLDSDNFYYIAGDWSNILLVDTTESRLNGAKNLEGWTLKNVTDFTGLTITGMTVTWQGGCKSCRLRRIRFKNRNFWQSGQGEYSPVKAVFKRPFSLRDPDLVERNSLEFTGDMSGARIEAEFLMGDSTSKTVTLYPAGVSKPTFTIVSMGRTIASPLFRTMEAVYNPQEDRIVDQRETEELLKIPQSGEMPGEIIQRP